MKAARTVAVVGMSAFACVSGVQADVIGVENHSFEAMVGSLPTPLLLPPLSGTLGDWDLHRSAVGGITGLTVPQIGFVQSNACTHGSNMARILFVANVVAQASFTQELDHGLEAYSRYVLSVDVGRGGIASVIADAEIRVYAGETLIASSDDPTFIRILNLNSNWDNYRIQFCTSANPPAGNLRVVLRAASIAGVISGVAFDHIQMDRNPNDCPCNFNGDCYVNSQDFFDFLSAFFTQDPRSDINRDGLANSQDYFDFCTCFFNSIDGCV